ncbi:hypothetical protein, partial [Dendronalium sp. ChiSLP03b]|uniref:hypothetical protein n=1 Tax=Dendronalium sp. ChiSLP03b TaxID=3075381 RepID=UPI00391CFE5A
MKLVPLGKEVTQHWRRAQFFNVVLYREDDIGVKALIVRHLASINAPAIAHLGSIPPGDYGGNANTLTLGQSL